MIGQRQQERRVRSKVKERPSFGVLVKLWRASPVIGSGGKLFLFILLFFVVISQDP